jgi:YVTN family beta-propeller protein
MEITPDGRKLFITSSPRKSLIVIDTVTERVLGELDIEPRAVKVSADGSKVYIFSPASSQSEARLFIIDSSSLKIINAIGLGKIGSAYTTPMPSAFFGLNRPAFRSKPAGLSE